MSQADIIQQEHRQQQLEVYRNLRKNTWVSFIDGSIYTFAMGMVPLGTVLLYYMGFYTNSNTLLGLFTTLHWLLYFTPQILIAKRIDSLKYYKSFALLIGLLLRLIWLFAGIMTFLLAKSHPSQYMAFFYVLNCLLGMLSGFNSIIWLNLIARVIPSDRISDFFAWRSSICGVLEICGAVVSGVILSMLGFPDNYGYLFIAVFVIAMVSLFFFNMTMEPKTVAKKASELNTREYLAKLRGILKNDKNYLTYLVSTAMIGGVGKTSLGFQIIFAKDKLAIEPGQVAVTSTLIFITQTIGYILWGMVIRKKGLKFAAVASSALFIPSIILTLWMPDIWVLYAAVTLMSLAQSFRNSNENKLIMSLAPNEESLASYIGLRNGLLGPFFSLNGVIGGFILDMTNFTVLTAMSLLFMIPGVMMWAFRLKVPEAENI